MSTRSRLTVAILLSQTCACTSGVLWEPKPNETEAIAIVIHAFDPASTESLDWTPTILWRDTDTLNCRTDFDVNGQRVETDATPPDAYGWWYKGVGCIDGFYFPPTYFGGPHHIEAAWFGKFSTSQMSHEMCHAWELHAKGTTDPEHTGPCFVAGGLVERAQVALVARDW